MPNFDKEAEDVLKYDGLPPLEPKSSLGAGRTVVFANVSSIFVRSAAAPGVRELLVPQEPSVGEHEGQGVTVIVRSGKIICVGMPDSSRVRDALYAAYGADEPVDVFDLDGGAISPGLTTFGSNLGLEEIQGEASTKDGVAPDALDRGVPRIAGGSGALIRAADGLLFATRHA